MAGGMSDDTSQLVDGGEMMSGRQNGPPINLIPVESIPGIQDGDGKLFGRVWPHRQRG